jgi:predicted ribosome quality control (RQC) complex YloA/Tae2 family protein
MEIEFLRGAITDLAGRLAGARIDKIHQPAADLFVFRLWTGRENLKLLISASSHESRIHLTDEKYPNPYTPPRFCQLLRSRLSMIAGLRQINDDRVVEIDCLGAKGECRLMVELTGRNSNLILVDSAGRIVDALKRITDRKGRIIAAGERYSYPPKNKSKLNDRGGTDPVSTMTENVRFNAEKNYAHLQATKDTPDLRLRLKKMIAREHKKLRRRINKIELELNRQQQFERYRQAGDLLLANLHLLKKGMQEVVITNYFLQPPVETVIDLNPVLGPQENAEKYFKKYKKARRGLEHGARRKVETEKEMEWLAQLEYQLEETLEPAEIALIADELRRVGILKEVAGRLPKVNAQRVVSFKETASPGGFRVLWGTNSRQNDTLSTKQLRKNDLWFHAYRCPGSHVVLKADPGLGQFGDEDIEFAATLAATNSKAKNDNKVEVMVAETKNVKKLSGSRSGMVTVKQYKTLVVKPLRKKPDVF